MATVNSTVSSITNILGYIGVLTIKNKTNNDYSNWTITCILPENSTINRIDLQILNIQKNIITLSPLPITPLLKANSTQIYNFSGNGNIPTKFNFSGTSISSTNNNDLNITATLDEEKETKPKTNLRKTVRF
jgi:hypothetical protein